MATDPYFKIKKPDQKNLNPQDALRLAVLFEKINSSRPASEIILDNQEVILYMHISVRSLVDLRNAGEIKYSQRKPRGKILYTYQDILDYYESGVKQTVYSKRKF